MGYSAYNSYNFFYVYYVPVILLISAYLAASSRINKSDPPPNPRLRQGLRSPLSGSFKWENRKSY